MAVGSKIEQLVAQLVAARDTSSLLGTADGAAPTAAAGPSQPPVLTNLSQSIQSLEMHLQLQQLQLQQQQLQVQIAEFNGGGNSGASSSAAHSQ